MINPVGEGTKEEVSKQDKYPYILSEDGSLQMMI